MKIYVVLQTQCCRVCGTFLEDAFVAAFADKAKAEEYAKTIPGARVCEERLADTT